MKLNSLLFSIFCFLWLSGNGQENEISTFIGVIPKGKGCRIGESFQLKFDTRLLKAFRFSTGLRHENIIQPNQRTIQVDNGPKETSNFIQSSFTSNKLDLTLLIIPINGKKFKLKTGMGLDIGRTLYSYTFEGIEKGIYIPEGFIIKYFTNYRIETLTDFGIHYQLTPSYYFKNNMFIAGQGLINKVFKEDSGKNIFRISNTSFSLGVGYRF